MDRGRGRSEARGRSGEARGRGEQQRGRGRGEQAARGRGREAARGRAAARTSAVMLPTQIQATRRPASNEGGEGWSVVKSGEAEEDQMPAGFVPRGGALAAPSTVEERVDDPYDPAEPNDYVEIQRERELRRAQDRRERQRQLHLERIEKEQEKLAEERRELARKELAGEVQTGRGRGVSNLPAWIKASRAPKAPTKPPSTDNATPSRVLVIANLAADNQLEDVEAQIRAECEKHGPLEALASHDDPPTLFVKFAHPNDALKAFVNLEGRTFAGRKLSCAFKDQAAFDAGNLT